MTNARFTALRAEALRFHRKLHTAVTKVWWRKYHDGTKWCEYDGPTIPWKSAPQQWLRRNDLPRVTLEEHRWLTTNRPNMSKYTRTFSYSADEFITSSDLMSESQRPQIHEVWIGARSMAVLPNEDTPAEFTRTNQLNEDSIENLHLNLDYPQNKDGEYLIEDDDGVPRPIELGDMVTTIRGSNDDLDGLYLEEADDPRQQNDLSAEGCEHRWSDRFRCNTDLEHKFLTAPCTKQKDKRNDYVVPHEVEQDCNWQVDHLAALQLAQARVEKILDRHPNLINQRLMLVDEAVEQIDRMMAKIKFSAEDGSLTQGYFLSRAEFWADREAIHFRRKLPTTCPPHPINWEQIRNKVGGRKVG